MQNQIPVASAEFYLKLILRIFGTSSFFALIFVAAPYSWMDSIHALLGMGTLSNQPVVGYLARSTSAFYTILGGLFWVISFDLSRHKKILSYLGITITLFGVALLIIDWTEGMPLFWKVWEGPVIIAFGLLIFNLNRKITQESIP